MSNFVTGAPGIRADRTATPRKVVFGGRANVLPGGRVINGALARDPVNTGDVDVLRAGLLTGKITATGLYAPSVIGSLGVACLGTATQMNLLKTAEATELVRRIGATGTFKLTGPQAAGGKVRTRTITYSAVGSGTPVNEVQTATPDVVATAGTYTISVTKADGSRVATAAIAFDANAAAVTLAINAVTGVVNGIVVTGNALSAGAQTITFSGTGYLRIDQPMVSYNVTGLTSTTAVTVVETTKGVPTANTVTVTAPGLTAANEVQTWTPNAAWTAGTMSFGFKDADDKLQWVVCTYTTDLAGTLAAINVLLDARFGTGAIVATGGGNITSLVFTYSGGAYAGRSFDLPLVDYTGATGAASTTSLVRTTAGNSAGFVAGSLVQPVDGSESPVALVNDGFGLKVTDEDGVSLSAVPFPDPVIGGVVDVAGIVNYPSDASLRAWLKAALRAVGLGYVFSDDFTA